MKRCSKCKEDLPIKEFGTHTQNRDGFASWCRKCDRKMKRNWCALHPHARWAYVSMACHKRKGCTLKFDRAWLTDKAKEVTHCPWCGDKIKWGPKNGSVLHNSPTLDRLRNSKIMTKRNVEIVCHRCNSAKGKQTLEEYTEWIKRAAKKLISGT